MASESGFSNGWKPLLDHKWIRKFSPYREITNSDLRLVHVTRFGHFALRSSDMPSRGSECNDSITMSAPRPSISMFARRELQEMAEAAAIPLRCPHESPMGGDRGGSDVPVLKLAEERRCLRCVRLMQTDNSGSSRKQGVYPQNRFHRAVPCFSSGRRLCSTWCSWR